MAYTLQPGQKAIDFRLPSTEGKGIQSIGF